MGFDIKEYLRSMRLVRKRTKRIDFIEKLIEQTPEENTDLLNEAFELPNTTVTDLKLLVTFGANPKQICLKNKEKPRKEFDAFFEHAQKVHDAQWNAKDPIKLADEDLNKKLIALSLDGGGIRGLVSVTTLMFLSRRLCGDKNGLMRYINWIAGTSTGSILALGLSKGLSLTDCFMLYMQFKDRVFVGASLDLFWKCTQQAKNLETVLQEHFKDERDTFHFAGRSNIRLTVPALNVKMDPAVPEVFRNYHTSSEAEKDDRSKTKCLARANILYWQGARASSAAPTYFDPFKLHDKLFVDGGLCANCPLDILFTEHDTLRLHPNCDNIDCVISIGTGKPIVKERKYSYGNRLQDLLNLNNVIGLLRHQVTQTDETMKRVETRCTAYGIPFFRFSPDEIDLGLDEKDDVKLVDMIWNTQVKLLDNVPLIDDLKAKLHDIVSNP